MPARKKNSSGNLLMDTLPLSTRRRLLTQCEQVDLRAGEILSDADGRIPYAWFPTRGFIALISVMEHHSLLGIGLVGHEGMLGETLMLDIRKAPFHSRVQQSGSALRIPAAELARSLQEQPALRSVLNRYLYVSMLQREKMTACAHFHPVNERLARWLLMAHDRAMSDTFRLTHRVLSELLGVQRGAISHAASDLQDSNIIRYSRGIINIVDRKALEAGCCSCYATDISNYRSHFRSADPIRRINR